MGAATLPLTLKSTWKANKIKPIHGRPGHPQNTGQNRTLPPLDEKRDQLDVYDSPMELEHALKRFVEYYNHQRYHESLQNAHPQICTLAGLTGF